MRFVNSVAVVKHLAVKNVAVSQFHSCEFLVEQFNLFDFRSIDSYSFFFLLQFPLLNPHLNAESVLQQMPP